VGIERCVRVRRRYRVGREIFEGVSDLFKGPIVILPCWRYQTIKMGTSVKPRGALCEPKYAYDRVVSHECEIIPRDMKGTCFAVAREEEGRHAATIARHPSDEKSRTD